MLADNCDAVEQKTYNRSLTNEELDVIKEELAGASIRLEDIDAEKKAAMELFKERIKAAKAEVQAALKMLRTRSEEVTEDCFKMSEIDSTEVGYYNSLGELIESRPMRPSERQRTIPFTSVTKTGTDN